ncbi:MAG: endolytic transglycosylase MltG [Pyrinomonadaceae bacterium]
MRLLRFSFILIVLALLIFVAATFWTYNALNSPIEHTRANEYIVIEKGSTPGQIVDKLVTEGVLEQGTATKFYLRVLGDAGKLQAGEYRFQTPITPLQALKELEKGETQTIKLTIPEGFTRFDIAKRIADRLPQNPPVDERTILAFMDDTSQIKDIAPEAENLEGYMYPSTYELPRGSTPQDAILVMVSQFKKGWKPEWNEAAKRLGRTSQEIVTIASLIETESKFEQERPIVASVIYNRLAKNIPLGIDQTVVYIAKMQNRWDGTIHKSDLDVDSPYNTRKYGGIPPGPISSVTESSINAALVPAKTDYIFYVLNVRSNDGSHNFYSSAAEFERGKAEYQRWLVAQRREKRVDNSGN